LSLLGKPDRYSELVATQVTDSLVQYDPGMRLVPRVAESWEISDDHRTVTFRLRDGVRWHDGRPVTADDVLFTVRQVRDPLVENPTFLPLFEDLASIEAPDPRTVRATFERARPEMLEAWRVPLLPAHAAESGAELLTGAYARHPIGCGPFRFVRHLHGEEIVLEANDDYWDGRPHLDRLVFRVYPDDRTGWEALLAGEVDTMQMSPELWHRARESERGKRLESLVYYRLNVWQVTWNHRAEGLPFDDPDVRVALTLALDRRKFADTVLQGLARPAVTTYHPELSWTDPAIEPWPYDPREAAERLERAGWVDRDGDGVRERDGRPFRFDLMVIASSQAMVDQLAAWLERSWSEIGVVARIDKLEWNLFRERRNAGEYHAAMYGISFTPNPDQWELYHSSATDGGFNYAGFADPEVDRLLEAGRRTFDDSERRRTYHALQRRLHELEPMAYLLHLATPVLHDRRLAGIEPSPLDEWRHTRGPRVWRWRDGGD
jgi:peptide/nickel transport system substrate-binding protein